MSNDDNRPATARALTEQETASYISMSVPFLRQARINGDLPNRTPGPPYVKIGRSVRYLIEDLDAWLLAHRIEGRNTKGGYHE